MDFVVLHFTLSVLLASILTFAACLSAYLVSRRQLFLLGAVGFFFYFFDVAWVFQDNIVGFGHMWHDQLYIAVRSIATIVSGVGFMSTFWLVICEYLGHSSLKMRVIPCLVFTAVDIIALIVPLPEDDNLARFIFYTPRAVFLAWMLLYAGARYVFTRDDFERKRIARANGSISCSGRSEPAWSSKTPRFSWARIPRASSWICAPSRLSAITRRTLSCSAACSLRAAARS